MDEETWFRSVPTTPKDPGAWPVYLPLEPDRTAETGPDLTHEFSVMDEYEPKHEATKHRRRLTGGVPWALAAAAMVVAVVAATDPFGEPTLSFPSPTARPAPKASPAVTRTVRVTAPAVTVQSAPRPAKTVYTTTTVTKTAEAKPAVTVTTTKTVTVQPEQPAAAPDD